MAGGNTQHPSKRNKPCKAHAKHIDKKYGVDWNLLKDEWVTTDASLGDLAKKYNVPAWKVSDVYVRERWKIAKDDYDLLLKRSHDEVLRARAEYTAQKIALLDNQVLHVSGKLVDEIEKNIDRYSSIEQKIDEIENGEIELNADLPPEEVKKAFLKEQKERISLIHSMNTCLKQSTEILKDAHYSLRLAGDRATSISEVKTENNHHILEENEEKRIEKEIGIVKTRKYISELVPIKKSQKSVDSNKSSQNAQK